MRICVIGGGAAAACFVMALARKMSGRSVELTVVEPGARLWCGTAFGPDLEAARVNAPPRIMSLDPDEPEQAMEWLATHHDPRYAPAVWDGETFPSRAVFGEYLHTQLTETLRELTSVGCWRFEHVQDVAVRVTSGRHGTVVKTSGRRTISCDGLVLCVGNGTSYDPYRLNGTSGYFPSPYPLMDAISKVPSDASVAVVGAGLAAVDVALGLSALGHQGPISLASRRGFLPSVRRPSVGSLPTVLTSEAVTSAWTSGAAVGAPLRLSTVGRLAFKEAFSRGATRAEIVRELDPPDWGLDRLRRQSADVNSSATWRQVVIWALFSTVQEWWPRLSDEDRRRFYADHHAVWASFINPMPRSSAQMLLELADQGRLKVERGLRRVTPSDRGFKLLSDQGTAHADLVISAASEARHAVPQQARLLVGSLLRAGLARLHPDGGLRVEPRSGRLVDRAGATSPHLFALGHLTGGTHYYISAIALLVARSQEIARFLHGESSRVAELRLPNQIYET